MTWAVNSYDVAEWTDADGWGQAMTGLIPTRGDPDRAAAEAALVQAVRDADRLTKARESVKTKLRTWPDESIQFSALTWVLDLLTEDGGS